MNTAEDLKYLGEQNEYFTNDEIDDDMTTQSFETEEDVNTLKQYYREIGRYGLLTQEESNELFKKAAQGDDRAFKEVINHNLRLVVKYARSIKRSYRSNEPIMDLIQAGNIGLIRAAQKYEYEKGYAFSTYASWWIRQSIVRHIYDHENAIRVPVHTSERLVGISRAFKNFNDENGRDPTFEELKGMMKISEKDYKLYKSVERNTISLNTHVDDESETELQNFIRADDSNDPVFDQVKENTIRNTVDEALDMLDDREKFIMIQRYGLEDGVPKTLEEVGRLMGLTRERVRQLEILAMKKLRNSPKIKAISSFII